MATNRWSTHRIFDDSIPQDRHQAHVFLQNAYLHLRNLGSIDLTCARGILLDIMDAVLRSDAEAA